MVNPRWRPEIANSRVPLKGPSNITKTGAKSVGKWKLDAAKAKLKMAKENLTQTFKETDKSLKKFKTTVKKQKKILED